MGGAKPFVDTVKSTSLDLELVKHELERVWIPSLLREQICKPLARTLGVKVDDLRDISPPSEKAHDFEDPEPWPQPVAGDLLLN